MSESHPQRLPAWARGLDAICLFLALLALVIFASGGFRERVFGVRLALTSPFRMLLWAIGLSIARHVLAPARPIYADLPARLVGAWRSPAVRTSLRATIGTRAAVLFVGYLAIFMIGFQNGRVPWRVAENEFANLPARWDVGWYLGIAVDGYTFSYHSQAEGRQQSIVFFPAMPLLMRVSGRLFGGTSTAFVWGGTVVSLLAFLGALTYLFRFARDVLGDDDRAALSVWLVATYPFAVWFGVPYTESLFLLGAAGAFVHVRRGEVWKGGAWGLLVGLTRPNGCFLSVPLAVVAIEPWLPAWLRGGTAGAGETGTGAGGRAPRTTRRLVANLLAASMPGIGMLAYSGFIWRLTSDPLSWAEGHVAWGRSYQGLSILVTERYEFLSQMGVYAYTSQWSNDLLQLMGVLFVLIAVWPVARRIGLAYAVFILINILPPLAAGGLLSAGRFSSVLFPAFVWLAGALKERHRPMWLATGMAIQALNAILFYTWREMI